MASLRQRLMGDGRQQEQQNCLASFHAIHFSRRGLSTFGGGAGTAVPSSGRESSWNSGPTTSPVRQAAQSPTAGSRRFEVLF
jgi:hypothetical protein